MPAGFTMTLAASRGRATAAPPIETWDAPKPIIRMPFVGYAEPGVRTPITAIASTTRFMGGDPPGWVFDPYALAWGVPEVNRAGSQRLARTRPRPPETRRRSQVQRDASGETIPLSAPRARAHGVGGRAGTSAGCSRTRKVAPSPTRLSTVISP